VNINEVWPVECTKFWIAGGVGMGMVVFISSSNSNSDNNTICIYQSTKCTDGVLRHKAQVCSVC
jgi:hypothetical protein